MFNQLHWQVLVLIVYHLQFSRYILFVEKR